ncbi:MAG: DUF5610 domain-containing protein [Pseudomonadota bacterium]
MNISSLPSSTAVAPLASGLPHSTPQSLPLDAKTSAPKNDGHETAEDKRQTALQLVNRLLTMAYEKISSRGQPNAAQTATDSYGVFEPLTATKVANNILGFIERRLQMDLADGATHTQLQSRLEAGLAGFKKGFGEASEKLKALSMLSPEIEADIGQTYELVLRGIDDLRSKFITASEKPADVATLKSTPKPTAKLEVPDLLPSTTKLSQAYGSYEYARASQFSFELTTAEGDTVTISANSSEGLSVEQGKASNGNSFYNASASSSQSSSWSVAGNLSEDEITAINELLGRVDTLAEQFFSGNLDEAFNQALALGYDESQIAGYALHLSQVEIQQATRAYGEFAPKETSDQQNNSPLLAEQLLPLGNFIKDLLDALDTASIFSEPQKLLENMSKGLPGTDEASSEIGKRFSDFVNRLFALDLEQHKPQQITE